MAKKFVCRVMGFGFSEMEKYAVKIEAKNLSTGSQRFSGSQHKPQSKNPQTQQHNERMNLQKTKALAQQSTKKQSQGSQSGALVKIFSESVGLSKRAKCRKQREWKEAMRILESHSDKPNSEGRKNKYMMKIQSQEARVNHRSKWAQNLEGFPRYPIAENR
jgi:hypothetical protein